MGRLGVWVLAGSGAAAGLSVRAGSWAATGDLARGRAGGRHARREKGSRVLTRCRVKICLQWGHPSYMLLAERATSLPHAPSARRLPLETSPALPQHHQSLVPRRRVRARDQGRDRDREGTPYDTSNYYRRPPPSGQNPNCARVAFQLHSLRYPPTILLSLCQCADPRYVTRTYTGRSSDNLQSETPGLHLEPDPLLTLDRSYSNLLQPQQPSTALYGVTPTPSTTTRIARECQDSSWLQSWGAYPTHFGLTMW